MGLPRQVLVACGVLMTAAAVGCEELIFPYDPCPDTVAYDPRSGLFPRTVDVVEDVGQMDWTWTLDRVNNFRLPFANPEDFAESVTKLDLHFDTDVTERGSSKCYDVKRTTGTTVAVVHFRKNGVNSIKRFAGTFRRNHETNKTSLYYGKFELPIQKSAEIFTTTAGQVIGPVDKTKIAFILTSGFVLKFDRQHGPGRRRDTVTVPTAGSIP